MSDTASDARLPGGHFDAGRPPQPDDSRLRTNRLLLEAAHDQLADWRRECEELDAAMEAWANAPPQHREVAFLDVLLALEREERAAKVYKNLIDTLGGGQPPARHGAATATAVDG